MPSIKLVVQAPGERLILGKGMLSYVRRIPALARSGDKALSYCSICCFVRLYLEVHVSVLIKTADVP